MTDPTDDPMSMWISDAEVLQEMMAAAEALYTAAPDDDVLRNEMLAEVNSSVPSTNRRVLLAQLADWFFSEHRGPATDETFTNPDLYDATAPRCVKDFIDWLGQQEGIKPPRSEVMRVLLAMEQSGLLLGGGYKASEQMLGQIFWSPGEGSLRFGMFDPLELAEAFGAEVIIPSYNSATVLIIGKDAKGKVLTGSGLAVGACHIVTNRHVVAPMETGIKVVVPGKGLMGVSIHKRPEVIIPLHKSQIFYDKLDLEDIDRPRDDFDVDVAVIQLITQPMMPMLNPLTALRFRDPRWGDTAYVFGYPAVQRTTKDDITVHSGTVVNPALNVRDVKVEVGEVVNPAAEVYDSPTRRRVFLYSSTARRGNSGGPIVAADGRVIGLVVQQSGTASGSDVENSADETAPFYFGIPSSEVIRAIQKLAVNTPTLENVAQMEEWT